MTDKLTKSQTKSEIIASIADETGLTRSQVQKVLDARMAGIHRHLKDGVTYVDAGLCKISVVEKAATPARSTTNPFTKQPMQIQAKPAYKTVRVKALKKLKTMASE